MFNHALDQNVGWERDVARSLVTYTALRDIKAGEELCKLGYATIKIWLLRPMSGISYGQRLTFKDADAPEPVTEDPSAVLSSIQLEPE